MIKLNMGAVEEMSVVPTGVYTGYIFDCVLKYGQTSGEPYFNWEFKIDGGEYDGRKIYAITSAQPHALFRMKQFLEQLDIDGLDLEGEIDFDPEMVIGKKTRFSIVHEKYKGELKAKIGRLFGEGEEVNEGVAEAPSKGLSSGKTKASPKGKSMFKK